MGKRIARLLRWSAVILLIGILAYQTVSGLPSPDSAQATVGSFSFTASGDFAQNNRTAANLDSIAAAGGAFHLGLGDLSYGSIGGEQQWCNFVKSHLNPGFPFEIVSGNHEDDYGHNGIITNFVKYCPDQIGVRPLLGESGNNNVGPYSNGYGAEYFFDYPTTNPLARIVLVAGGLVINGTNYSYKLGSQRYNWLSSTIDDARSQGIPWVIVGEHHPCLDTGTEHFRECDMGVDLMNLLISKRVDLVLVGHEHDYQRSKQLKCATKNFFVASCVVNDGSTSLYAKGAGTIFIVQGTAGQNLTRIGANPDYNYFARTNDNTYGYVKYTLNSTSINAKFVATTGTFTDGFTIAPRPQYPEIVGWGGTKLDETVTYDPGNPASQVFPNEQSSNAEVQVARLAQLGYDGWRLSFAPFCKNPNGFMGRYTPSQIERGINIAKHFDLWIIIDYHGYHDLANATGAQCWLDFWSGVVQQFKDSYSKIVWEPLNEPGGFGDNNVQYLSVQYQRWIDQARSLGDTHWIVAQNLCSLSCSFDNLADGFPTVTDPLGRVFISLHSYMAYLYNLNSWNNATAEIVAHEYYQAVLDGQARTGWPVLNTEGGAVPSSSEINWPPDTIVNGSPCPGCNGGASGYSITSLHFIQALVKLYDSYQPQRINWVWWTIGSWSDTPGAGTLGAIAPDGWGNLLQYSKVTPPPNLSPVLSLLGSRTVDEKTLLKFTVAANDPNGDSISFSCNCPAGASIDSSKGIFSWIPTEAQGPGIYNATISVTDSFGASASGTFTITVNEVNSPPILSVPPPQTVDEGNTLTFKVSAVDPDIPVETLTLASGPLPSRAAFNATTGSFLWTPSEEQGPGTYTVSFTVTDGSLTDTETVIIKVLEVNQPPIISVPGPQTVDELKPLTFTVSATDPDIPANTITFSCSNCEDLGASFHTTTGAFSWTPSEAQGPGDYTLTFTATDNGIPSLSDMKTVMIHVNEVNSPPVLRVPQSQIVEVNKTITFRVNATDPDIPANVVSLSASDLVPGMSFDPASGVFSFTPTTNQNLMTFIVSFTATDDGSPPLTDMKTVSFTVATNSPPIIVHVENKTVDEQTLLTFTVSATDLDIGQTLSFSLGTGAPSGASITDQGVFTWTPTEAQGPADYTVTIIVTDNGSPPFSDEKSIVIHVNEVNQAPVLLPMAHQTLDEGTLLTFNATATDPDIPANSLTFSLGSDAPTGASINPVTGVFSWTPSEAQGPGDYTITITVTDNGTLPLSATTTVSIHVNEVNTAPILQPIGNKVVDEETPLTFAVTAVDSDLPPNHLSFHCQGCDAIEASLTNDGLFSWTPSEAQGPGNYTLTIVVTDDGSPPLSASETITIHVNEVNKRPVVQTITDKNIDEETTLTFIVNATDPDIPVNTLTFSLDPGAPTGASITTGGLFSWTPTESQGPGTYVITVLATDNGTPRLSGSTFFTVFVSEVNRPPALLVPNPQTVDEGTSLTFTIQAIDPDLPPNNIRLLVVPSTLPAGASFNRTIGEFRWTPSEAQGPGDYTITFQAIDNGTPPLYDIKTVQIHVNEVNQPPLLAPIGNKVSDEGTLLAFTATAADPDIPANSLTFSLGSDTPTGASIDPVTGVFSWTPSEAQGPGDYTITITVTDDGTPSLSDTKTFFIHVNEVNQPPVLESIGNQTVDEQTILTLTARASDPDVPANILAFSLSPNSPLGASIDSATGVFSWTPTEAQGPGDYTITVTVTDDGSPPLSDSKTITIRVNEVNQPPVLTVPGPQYDHQGSLFTFTVSATDPDIPANIITISASNLPSGAAFDPVTKTFSWRPTSNAVGTFTVTFTATDNGTPSLSDVNTVVIYVTKGNGNCSSCSFSPDLLFDPTTLTSFSTSTTLSYDSRPT